ncbi:MAG TPA: response regulator, partial [Terriglobales bacterium]|nr:response regulator [Terriglobales bacterium]
MKILLADDSVTAQNMGKKILVEAGHEVVCVSNGAAALKKVAEQGPDLVILDIYMPGYSGLEVCQRLREARNTADLPVVLTVGKLEPFRKEDAQRVRAEALIVKPFEASELAAAVARFTEIVAAKPAKKNKAKDKDKEKEKEKSQEADPKREWEEYSDEDFVTTSQKLIEKEEEESLLRGGDSLVAASEPATGEPAESNTEHDSANEFEVSAGPAVLESTTEAPSASAAQVGFAVEEIAPEGAGSPVPQPVACTEFSVEPENTVVSPNVEVETPAPAEKATAAAAGADFGSSVPEFVSAATSVPRFVARPSAEIPCAEPTAITPETVAEPAGLP